MKGVERERGRESLLAKERNFDDGGALTLFRLRALVGNHFSLLLELEGRGGRELPGDRVAQ